MILFRCSHCCAHSYHSLTSCYFLYLCVHSCAPFPVQTRNKPFRVACISSMLKLSIGSLCFMLFIMFDGFMSRPPLCLCGELGLSMDMLYCVVVWRKEERVGFSARVASIEVYFETL